MRIADKWEQYKILDTSSEEKLEDWNGVKLIRPDPQIIWKTPKNESLWKSADGHYHRSSSGGGSWDDDWNHCLRLLSLFKMVKK